MEHLTTRERELVAIGAALASNCVPCIKNHIPKARKAGLSDSEINEAITLADELRQVPAANVLNTARTILGESSDANSETGASAVEATKPCCAG
jgi:4-carboxymuconolactone decarboxylase